MSDEARPGRRPKADTPRDNRFFTKLGDDEAAMLIAAARRAGLSPGAYMAGKALAAAEADLAEATEEQIEQTVASLRAHASVIAGHNEALAELRPQRDELIRLLGAAGLSYREIAGHAGVSWVTVGEILKATP